MRFPVFFCRFSPAADAPTRFGGGVPRAVEDRMDEHSAIAVPVCPVCEQAMSTLSTPKSKFFPLPKSRTFECKRCAVIATTSEMQRADSEHMRP
jgi:hypothetical protein